MVGIRASVGLGGEHGGTFPASYPKKFISCFMLEKPLAASAVVIARHDRKRNDVDFFLALIVRLSDKEVTGCMKILPGSELEIRCLHPRCSVTAPRGAKSFQFLARPVLTAKQKLKLQICQKILYLPQGRPLA
jgi:hypothetical protein